MRALPLLLLLSCGYMVPPPPDMAPIIVSQDPCAGWGCVKDADCPPTLCAWVDGKGGRCEASECRWSVP